NKISSLLRERKSTSPVSFKKKAVSHQVPKPSDKAYEEVKKITDPNDIFRTLYTKMCKVTQGVK
ncbi:MAG: hypothetical protein WCX79_02740, partial [Candidatus Paceibacterota bacterium]